MTIPATTAPAQQQQAAPGQYFDVPGVPGGATQWLDEDETSTNVVTQHQTGAGQQIQGILPFRQTDVILDWQMWLGVQQTYTAGTSTLTASIYAPYNLIGRVQLVIQNQYASVDVESGIDLYIFSLVRPYEASEMRSSTSLGQTANPGGTTDEYLTAVLRQFPALNVVNWSSALTNYRLSLRLPASQWFDEYYDLALTGEPTMQAHAAVVSPQYMAGTTRNIIPRIWVAPNNAANLDQGPVNIGDGTGTATVSSTTRFRRRGVYAGNQAVQPPVYAWQYRWKTERFAVGGRQRSFVIIPLDTGQLLFTYLRFWDPGQNNGLGGSVPLFFSLANAGAPGGGLTACNLQYGSGLKWFDARTEGDLQAFMLQQRKWLETHDHLLPQGVIGYDLALDTQGQMSNKRALNTLTTAGIQHEFAFTNPLSPTTYVVLGCESLVYVS